MDSSRSHRPHSVPRHVAGLLTPTAAAASRVALERAAPLRLQRLRVAATDGARERIRPRRPRMRALRVGPGGALGWHSTPVPAPPGPLAAVVRPIAVATCDMDRSIALGATPFPLPLQLGHECVAEVLAVGAEVRDHRPGQRVVVPFQISCGACPPCRDGRTGSCASVPPISMYGFGVAGGHWGGAIADELAVPFADGMLVPLPGGVDPAAAASVADNASDAYRHIAPHLPQLRERQPDAPVLIVAGMDTRSTFSASVALYTGQVALALGAARVVLVDARADVRDHAERLGLEALEPAALRGRLSSPLVVDMSASSRGLAAALAATAPDGVCSSAGGLHRIAKVPASLMYGRNVTLHLGRSHIRSLIPHVLELVAAGRLHPERVITQQASLDDAVTALGDYVRAGGTKTVLTA